MQRFYLLALLVPLSLGCGAKGKQSGIKDGLFDPYESREAFIHAIELGDADADAFVVAVQLCQVLDKDVLCAREERNGVVATATVAGRLGSVLFCHDALHLLEHWVHG